MESKKSVQTPLDTVLRTEGILLLAGKKGPISHRLTPRETGPGTNKEEGPLCLRYIYDSTPSDSGEAGLSF